jgi:hypothetical protein
MKLPSFSIATLMFLVAIAGVDGYLLHQIDEGEDNPEIFAAASIFVMVNILALGFLRILSRRGKNCPFVLGFVVAGFMAILACLGGFRCRPDQMEDLVYRVVEPIEALCVVHAPQWIANSFYQDYLDQHEMYLKIPMILAVVPIATAPFVLSQLSIALIGGLAARVIAGTMSRGVLCDAGRRVRQILDPIPEQSER